MARESAGLELKIRRLRAGLKQYELAGRLGIPQTILSQIELGKRIPPPELVARILEILQGHSHEQCREAGKPWERDGD